MERLPRLIFLLLDEPQTNGQWSATGYPAFVRGILHLVESADQAASQENTGAAPAQQGRARTEQSNHLIPYLGERGSGRARRATMDGFTMIRGIGVSKGIALAQQYVISDVLTAERDSAIDAELDVEKLRRARKRGNGTARLDLGARSRTVWR